MSLSPLEAYEAVMRFARDRGQWPLRLAMHAAVAQSFRPLFLHLVKLNFLVETANDPSVESDVLLAPFCEEIGAGYYQFDPQVRALLLDNLQAVYASESKPRFYGVAALLLAYLQEQERSIDSTQDRLSQSYIDVQRWVALSILDPEGAAHQLAAALNQVAPQGESAVRLQIGGLVSLLAEPLLRYPMLADYALGVQALERGEFEKARQFLSPLGDGEFEVGPVKLRPAASLLGQWVTRGKPSERESLRDDADSEEYAKRDKLQRGYGEQALDLWQRGRLNEALDLLKKQEAICLELGNKDGLQSSYGSQASIFHSLERLDEALDLLKKQEAICLELGNKDGLQSSYGSQASIFHSLGRLDEALYLLKEQEAICLELGNKDGLQRSYGSQASVFRSLERRDEALDLLKKQEAICLELGNKDGLQRSYGSQASVFRSLGRLDEALDLLKKQEVICLELGNKDGLQRSYGSQASVFRSLGRLDEALDLLKKQEVICLELGNKRDLGHCYRELGLLARVRGDRKTERQKLEQAITLFSELGMSSERDKVQAELRIEGSDGPISTAAAFFSYSREDSEFALRLAEDLRTAGAAVWIDQLDIEPGTRWDRAIEDALNNCPRMLVILSPLSVKSDNVRDEISFALKKQKTVIPILHLDCDLPIRLARLQYIDFRSDYAGGLEALLKTLGVEKAAAASNSQASAAPASTEVPLPEVDTSEGSVFLGYSREDSEFALRLAKDLKVAGANVWLDQLHIVPGQRWDLTIQDALTYRKNKNPFQQRCVEGTGGHPLCVTGRLSDEEWPSGSNGSSQWCAEDGISSNPT